MPYDAKNDPYSAVGGNRLSFGKKGVAVTPNDRNDLATYAKTIVVLSAGNVVILPVGNDDGVTLTFTGLSAGQVVPFQVRRVVATGTTATVAAVID